MATYSAYQVVQLGGLLQVNLNTGTDGVDVSDYSGIGESGDDTSILGDINNDSFSANTGLLGLPENFTYGGVVKDQNGEAVGFIGQQVGNLVYKVFVPEGTDLSSGLSINLLEGVPDTADLPWDVEAGAPLCFMPGTAILTEKGEVCIENLKIGDTVLTADGGIRTVRWIGLYTVDRRFGDPLKVLPICIKAGALAENVPSRDLRVSPDHALFINGILVHASALVNEMSIFRDTDAPEQFTYYHIEVDGHSLVLAENVPAETFVDNVSRMNFDNWDEYDAISCDIANIEEMNVPRAKSARQVPATVKNIIINRCEALGISRSAAA